jgi:hypothetical protein
MAGYTDLYNHLLETFARMSDKTKVAFLAIACALGLVVLGVLFYRNNANVVTEECVHSLYHLCEAKGAWAREHQATNGATPTWSDLRPHYIGPANWPTTEPAPRCPGGGTWAIGRIDEMPTCSIAAHTAALRHEFEEIKNAGRNNSSNAFARTANSPGR